MKPNSKNQENEIEEETQQNTSFNKKTYLNRPTKVTMGQFHK